jgi:hypothetical protein
VTDNQQRAAEIIDTAPLLDMGNAIAAALDAAEARGAERVAQRIRALADEIGGQQHGIPGEAYLYAANRLRAVLAEVTPPAAEQEGPR